MSNETAKQPSHTLYHVVEGNKSNRWNEIGAAWTNKDGSFSIKLNYYPVDSEGRIQMRVYEPKQQQAAA